MMQDFYKDRLKRHQGKMMRYLKYVFNDHIVLISVFLLGGFGYYYSNFVKQLDDTFIVGKVVLAVLWLFALFSGKLATLMEEADEIFILPKESQMTVYLKASYRHSLSLPISFLFLLTGISMPLLLIINHATVLDFFFYFILLASAKSGHLLTKMQELYQENKETETKAKLIWFVGSSVAIVSSLFVASWIGTIIAVSVFLFERQLVLKTEGVKNLNWEAMIEFEQSRLKKIYTFINLFTDVPGISGKVKRRKILDPLLVRIKKTHDNTYFYLYSRSFIRGSEYSGLLLRLVVVGSIMLLFLKQFWLSLAISMVVVYLIGFQLIPLYGQFDYMVMTKLYPVPENQKKQAMTKLLSVLLGIVWFVLSVVVMIALPSVKESGMIIGVLAVEIILFIGLYVPRRLKKMAHF